MSPGLLNGVPHDSGDPAFVQYAALKDGFEKRVRPLAEASIDSLEARKRFTEQIPAFVEDVDRFVQTLENGLNTRLGLLQKILTLILFGAMGVSFMMLFVMQRSIFRPLLAIGAAADAVRKGDFSVRAEAPAPNEIGRLSTSFNFMVAELGRLYGNLEQEVEKKTEDLNRRNAGLLFLSRVAQSAAWGAVFRRHSLDGMLDESCEQFGARAVRLVVSTDGTPAALAQSRDWPKEAPESASQASRFQAPIRDSARWRRFSIPAPRTGRRASGRRSRRRSAKASSEAPGSLTTGAWQCSRSVRRLRANFTTRLRSPCPIRASRCTASRCSSNAMSPGRR